MTHSHNLLQKKYWDQIAQARYLKKGEAISYPALKEMKGFFDFLNPSKKRKIIEIGCGTGRYTIPLLKMGCHITATEISSRSITFVKDLAKEEKVAGSLKLVKTSFETKTAVKKFVSKFDQALLVAVVHHFDPLKRDIILENIVSCLKRGGELVVLEPNPLNPFYYFLYFYRWLVGTKDANHWVTEKGMLFTNSFSLKNYFERHGLKNIEIRRYAFLPSGLGEKLPFILKLNDFITKTFFIKNFSAFIWIKGKKK